MSAWRGRGPPGPALTSGPLRETHKHVAVATSLSSPASTPTGSPAAGQKPTHTQAPGAQTEHPTLPPPPLPRLPSGLRTSSSGPCRAHGQLTSCLGAWPLWRGKAVELAGDPALQTPRSCPRLAAAPAPPVPTWCRDGVVLHTAPAGRAEGAHASVRTASTRGPVLTGSPIPHPRSTHCAPGAVLSSVDRPLASGRPVPENAPDELRPSPIWTH